MITFTIQANAINSWDDFHDLFYERFNFPEYYGRNLNAWIDCMDDVVCAS